MSRNKITGIIYHSRNSKRKKSSLPKTESVLDKAPIHLQRHAMGHLRSAQIKKANRPSQTMAINVKLEPKYYTPDFKIQIDGIYYLPPQMQVIRAISIHDWRYNNFVKRLGPWAKYAQKLPGTNGNNIDKRAWLREKKIIGQKLKRGELGCYDSHVRLWHWMVTNKIPYCFICEDDANFNYSLEMSLKLQQAFTEIETFKLDYDVLYIGHGSHEIHKRLTPLISQAKGTYGLFAYVMTLKGAQKALNGCLPYIHPIDNYIGARGNNGTMNVLAIDPSLFYVVPVVSSTNSIR